MSPSSTSVLSHGRMCKLLVAFLLALLVFREWASSRILAPEISREVNRVPSSNEAATTTFATASSATEETATAATMPAKIASAAVVVAPAVPQSIGSSIGAASAVSAPARSAIDEAATTTARALAATTEAAPQLKPLHKVFQPWLSNPDWLRWSKEFCSPFCLNCRVNRTRCSEISFRVNGGETQMYLKVPNAKASCRVARWPSEVAVAILPNFWTKTTDGSFCKRAGKDRSEFNDLGLRSGTCNVTILHTRDKCPDAFFWLHGIWCLLQLTGSHCDIAATAERHRLLLRLSGIPRMVDAGANLGDSSLVLAGYGNEVFAFEPGDQYQASFKLNFRANSWLLQNGKYPLNLIARGVSDTKKVLWYSGHGSTMHTMHGKKAQCERHKMPWDDQCNPFTVERVDNAVPENLPIGLFKVDVEGLEARVLWGAHKLFCSSAPPRIVEFEHARVHGVPQCGIPSDYYGKDCRTILNNLLQRLYRYGYNCSFVTSVDQLLSISMATTNEPKQHSLQTLREESLKVGLGVSSLEALRQRVPPKSDVICVWRRIPKHSVCTGPQT